MPKSVAAEVAKLLDGRDAEPDDLVFTAALGGALRESRFVRSYFRPAVTKANELLAKQPKVKRGDAKAAGNRLDAIPGDLRFYDLRHTAASLLIREGASIKAVQKQMGHATAATTLDTYGHLYPDELDQVAERLERLRRAALKTRASVGVWPHRGPEVVPLRRAAGQKC